MPTKRVFFSFHLPAETGKGIINEIERLHLPITLYPAENLHITLRFIGGVGEQELATLTQMMEEISSNAPGFPIFARELYIADQRLRLVIDPVSPLMALNSAVISRLNELGIGKADQRPYLPHITMGRPNSSFSVDQLRHINFENYRFFMREVGLYESTPGESKLGSYILLKSFPLRG